MSLVAPMVASMSTMLARRHPGIFERAVVVFGRGAHEHGTHVQPHRLPILRMFHSGCRISPNPLTLNGQVQGELTVTNHWHGGKWLGTAACE